MMTRTRRKQKIVNRAEAAERSRKSLAQNRAQIVSRVNALALSVCEAEGIELVHIEFQNESRGLILRVYIDKAGGITLEDCSAISRQLSDLLDVYLEMEATYHLEVSSPGPERPLSKGADYDRFKGRMAKIRLAHAVDGQKNFTGILEGILEDNVLIRINEQQIAVPLAEITKARLTHHNGEHPC